MVVVSRADMATMSACLALTASINFSGETLTPRSRTSKPPPSSREATRFLPISCKSPLTVPMATRPTGLSPRAIRSGRMSSRAPFMARAEMSNSGTKYSFDSKRRPTSSMAGTICSLTSFSGSIPAARASLVISWAVLASPLTTAS